MKQPKPEPRGVGATIVGFGRGASGGGIVHRPRFLLSIAMLTTTAAAAMVEVVVADVVVFANRSTARVTARMTPVGARAFDIAIDVGDVVPVFVDGRSYISFNSRGQEQRYMLSANSVYRFGNLRDGRLAMEEIGLHGDDTTADGRSLPGTANSTPVVTIPVKLLVDEEEPGKQFLWERRLRQRIERASVILEKHCRLRLKVVAVDTWNSDNRTTEFFDSFGEFEKEVNPFPGQLAIGFTSQYQMPSGRVHLGGTRGSFHTHILIREWSRHVGEPERLELLVHELGHFLGASHSPAKDSVMRPVLGDRQAIRANFQIRFDPINTLVIAMVVEEVRRRHIRSFSELTAGTKRRLRQVNARLADKSPAAPPREKHVPVTDRAATSPLVKATQYALQAIVRAARENHNRPESETSTGDPLTELYVRAAAAAAVEGPEKHSAEAFLFAMGIALDDTATLRNLPKTQLFVTSVESGGQRSVRSAFMGDPTLGGRADLAKHFFVSAYLAALQGDEAALAAGLAKEMLDTRPGGSGFSFADIAADKAGIRFARAVLDEQVTLQQLADGFAIDAHMPPIDGLTEGLTAAQVLTQFGLPEDGRFQQQLRQIDRQLQELPAYTTPSSPAE